MPGCEDLTWELPEYSGTACLGGSPSCEVPIDPSAPAATVKVKNNLKPIEMHPICGQKATITDSTFTWTTLPSFVVDPTTHAADGSVTFSIFPKVANDTTGNDPKNPGLYTFTIRRRNNDARTTVDVITVSFKVICSLISPYITPKPYFNDNSFQSIKFYLFQTKELIFPYPTFDIIPNCAFTTTRVLIDGVERNDIWLGKDPDKQHLLIRNLNTA
jgi:hypothetical protein